MRKLIYIVLILILITKSAKAEEDTIINNKYGLFGGFNMHQFIASFKKLPDVPTCCPNYNNGSGTGFNFGLLMEVPLPLGMHIALKGGMNTYSGSFYSYEGTLVKVDSVLRQGLFKHDLQVKLLEYFIEPYIKFKVVSNFNVYLGGHFGSYSSSTFTQKEVLVEPADRGVFVDTKTRTRNQVSDKIKNTDAMSQNLFFGADYALPLNRSGSFQIVPFFQFSYGLSNVIRDLNWKINTMSFGAAFKYTKVENRIIPPMIYRTKTTRFVDTLIVESDKILKRAFINGIEQKMISEETILDTVYTYESITRTDTIYKRPLPKTQVAVNTKEIVLKSQYLTEGYPVLPVVFFDPMSDQLSAEYSQLKTTQDFKINNLEMNPIVFHYNILNIIGTRMNEDPNQIITLQGYADSVIEKGNCDLAKRRVETIKNYLINAWKIAPNRILTKTKDRNCSPKDFTIAQNDSGYRENMRVEISSDNKKLLASVLRKKALQILEVEPQIIKIDPKGTTENGVKEWYCSLSAGDDLQYSFNNGTEIPEKVEKTVTIEDGYKLKKYPALDLEYGIVDTEGKVSNVKKEIKITIDTSRFEFQRLSLILFGFNSDKVPEPAIGDLKAFLANIDKSAMITISGYTDFLGKNDYNMALSQRRAQNTANLIRQFSPEANIVEIAGYGFNKYPPGITRYSTPVERFLSRTVQVEIVRPRDNK